jgi:hypothetical protein
VVDAHAELIDEAMAATGEEMEEVVDVRVLVDVEAVEDVAAEDAGGAVEDAA